MMCFGRRGEKTPRFRHFSGFFRNIWGEWPEASGPQKMRFRAEDAQWCSMSYFIIWKIRIWRIFIIYKSDFCDIIEQDCPKLWILFDVRADFLLISFMDYAIILLERIRNQNKLTAEDEKRRTPRKQ